MIAYRHAPPGSPFLWESSAQPAGRWHAAGEGPVQYFATSPDAAWAEFVRHEEITHAADLLDVRRALWAVDVPEDPATLSRPSLEDRLLRGGRATYAACQREARRLRQGGATALVAPSAAWEPGPSGNRVEGGLVDGPTRQDQVIVAFGRRSDLVGWLACAEWRPSLSLIGRVRPLRTSPRTRRP
jgi:hypothetical protein